MNAQIFGERVRYLRIGRGWEQDELARRIGKSVATISRIENGTSNLALDVILALARAFEVPVATFFTEDGHLDGDSAEHALLRQLMHSSQRLPEPVLKSLVSMLTAMEAALQAARHK